MRSLSCPDRDTLFGYLVGTITESAATAVAGHLAACPACEQTAQALESLSDTILAALRHPSDSREAVDDPGCRSLLEKLRGLEMDRAAGNRSDAPVTASPRRVRVLGDYELLKKLGEGRMGAVYLARHTKLKRTVALKVLSKNRLASAEAIARFEREIEAVGRLDHPHIVRALDARDVDGIRFLVMEYVDGLDLSDVVRRLGPLGVADGCEVVRQACLGLQCSHENGLVHRDVKPSNLMLTVSGEVKVLDLGLAHIQQSESDRSEITGINQLMGTPDYLSPEQAQGQPVDIRTDIYSLGCTLYHLLSGRAPFSGPDYDTPMKKISGHIRDGVPPVQLRRQDVPKPVAVLLERMLAKDANQRPGTPSQVADALAPYCQGSKLIGLLREARRRQPEDEKGHSRVETDELRTSGRFDTDPQGKAAVAAVPAGAAVPEAAPFDPYHRWLGIAPEEQPPDHYRLLGIARFESDPEVVRDAAARQMAHVRTYHLGQHAELSQNLLNELGAAKACLLNPQKKAAYDAGFSDRRHAVDLPQAESNPQEGEAVAAGPPVPIQKELPVSVRQQASESTVAPLRSWLRRLPPRGWIAGGLAAVFALLTLVIYIATNTGRVKITLSDPNADVAIRVDGNEVEIRGLGEPLRLRPGPHELAVTGKGYETLSSKFLVRRGDDTVLTVELVPRSAGRDVAQTPSGSTAPAEDAQVATPTDATISVSGAGAASTSEPTAGARRPLFTKGSPRVLGFYTGSASERLAEYASYTNIVQTSIGELDQLAPIARRHKLSIVVNAELPEGASGLRLEDSVVESIRRHQGVVTAICWHVALGAFGGGRAEIAELARRSGLPRRHKLTPGQEQSEIAQFGQYLQTVLPDVQFWCNFVVNRATADAIGQVPPEVDCLSLFVPFADDPENAQENASAVGSWITKVNRRPALLMWFPLRSPAEAETVERLQRWVERYNLDGLMLAGYSEGPLGAKGMREDERVTAEVKKVAAAWGVSRPSAAVTLDMSPTAAGSPEKPTAQEHALLFDGIKSHVDMTEYAYNGKYPITVEAYVVPLSYRFGVQHIFSNRGGDGGGIWLYLSGFPRRWAFHLANPIAPESTEVATLSRRVHIAGVYDLQRSWLFVDGKQQGDPIRTGFNGPAHKYSYVGADPDHYKKAAGAFHGIIEQFRISRTARYQGDFTPEPVLQSDNDTLVLYRFDGGSGKRARDLSGNGYDGVIKDAQWVNLKDYLEPQEESSVGVSGAPAPNPTDTESAQPTGGKTGT
ncbi:MAG: protein kinase [Pirellulales bacterium]|nr:protein kinase [Pirellulales bacterium]